MCPKCKLTRHYSAMCYNKAISMVEQDKEDNLDSAFLDTPSNSNKSVWSSKIDINGKMILFSSTQVLKSQPFHLVVRTDAFQMQSTRDLFIKKFPKIFHGLGTIAGQYHINLQFDAKPTWNYYFETHAFHCLFDLKSQKNWNIWRKIESYQR